MGLFPGWLSLAQWRELKIDVCCPPQGPRGRARGTSTGRGWEGHFVFHFVWGHGLRPHNERTLAVAGGSV